MTGRDNGLSAASYVFLAKVGPPEVDDVLTDLREEGIAAYAVPTAPPVYSLTRAAADIQLPTERLYVDRLSVSYAHVLLRRRLAEEDAWDSIVDGYHRDVPADERPWPTAEEVATDESEPASTESEPPVYDEAADDDHHDDDEADEHYEPPPPPPLPKDDPITKAATAVIGVSLAYLVASLALDWYRHGWLVLLAIAGVIAGVVTHVVRIRDPRTPGSDDGAHV